MVFPTTTENERCKGSDTHAFLYVANDTRLSIAKSPIRGVWRTSWSNRHFEGWNVMENSLIDKMRDKKSREAPPRRRGGASLDLINNALTGTRQ